jgi:hypothetical protein
MKEFMGLKGVESDLIDLNDNAGYNFEEIADYIETSVMPKVC